MSTLSLPAPKRVVIFGGSGFIGRHLTAFLGESCGSPEILLADIVEPTWAVPANAKYVQCDVRKPIAGIAESAVDLIINLAAVHRTPGHPDHEYHETNEGGATNVVAFAEEVACGRIWFTSSIAVYGPDEEPKTEQSVPAPVSAYGKSKLAAEEIHREWAGSAANRTLTIARPATVFGQGEGGNFTRLAGALRRRIFFYPGRRDTLKACGYVKDLGPAFSHMERTANPDITFNFAYPTPPTIEEVCAAFCAAGEFPMPKVTIPSSMLMGAGRALKAVGLESFDPERIQKLMHSTNVRGDGLQAAGYEWDHSLESGIRDWHESAPAGEFD